MKFSHHKNKLYAIHHHGRIAVSQSIITILLIQISLVLLIKFAESSSSSEPHPYHPQYRRPARLPTRNKRSSVSSQQQANRRHHHRAYHTEPSSYYGGSPEATATVRPPDLSLPENDMGPEEAAGDPGALCGLPLARLPAGRLVPSHYDLMMMPNLSSSTFEGAVQINVHVRKLTITSLDDGDKQVVAANQIVLHADDSLVIDNIWYRNLGVVSGMMRDNNSAASIENRKRSLNSTKLISGNYIDVVDVCRDPEYQLLVVTLAKDLEPASRGQLYLTYSGILSNSLRGFYRSYNGRQVDNNSNTTTGEPNYLATTQFQATEARRAFPCFDEPALKATFDVSLVHPIDQLSLANMEPTHERLLPQKGPLAQFGREQPLKLVRFARTPPISTYLVAFMVGQLDHIERNVTTRRNSSTLRIRVHAQRGRSQMGSFALDTASRAYKALEEYCLIELPMRKLDLVAVADFEAGAMENWGLVTFKDQQLLVDPANTTPVSRALIGGTVVHELAHHWFGNLVTLKWWNELWLNEGFATWFEHRIMEQLYPELEFQFHYLLDSHIHALNQDSFRSAHPVRPEPDLVNDPQDIDDSFDAISYNKAAAIIRSLHDDYMKPEPFKLAIRKYLANRKYSTATTQELCHYMELASNKTTSHSLPPVCQYLNSWLLQAGHPLISVRVEAGDRKLVLSQARFVTNVANLTQDESEQRWLILVKLLLSDATGSRQELVEVLMRDDNDLETNTNITLPSWFNLTNQTSGHWLKLNTNFSGFYRTLYPVELFRRLGEPMRNRLLLPGDRLNLVDETHAMVLANRLGAEHLVELLSWLVDENHGAVLDAATAGFSALLKLFDNASNLPELRKKLLDFGRLLFGSMLGRQLPVNYLDRGPKNSTSHMLEMGRSAVLNLLVQINHELALQEAVRNFDQTLDLAATQQPLPHLRASFYTAVARNGSEEHYGRLLSRLVGGGRGEELEGSREELVRLATALAKSEHRQRLAKLWDWLRNPASKAAANLDRIEIVNNMIQAGPIGRQFVRQLLEDSPQELMALNQERPVTSLIEELCISSGASQFHDLSGLFVGQKNLIDWSSSRDYIKRLLDWQAKLQMGSAKKLEQVLDHYLLELPARFRGGGGGGDRVKLPP